MKKPTITFLFLCDGHNFGPAGKLNCFGIFNIIRAWAFPAQREASVIMYLYNILKREKVSIHWISPNGEMTLLGKATLKKSSNPYGFTSIAQHLPIPIKEKGIHTLVGKIGEKTREVPIIVNLEKWPELSNEEIKKALEDPNSIKSARMEISCGKCGRTYIFEVHLDPNKKNTPGTYPFPKSRKFKCKTRDCNTLIYTKDYEGYVRSLLAKTPTKKG